MHLKRILAVFFFSAVCLGQQSPDLTISSIFAEGGITGRAPEAIKWSPDGKKISYLFRDDRGEKTELYYIDVATDKPAVLVTAEKLRPLTASLTQGKDDRERDNRER